MIKLFLPGQMTTLNKYIDAERGHLKAGARIKRIETRRTSAQVLDLKHIYNGWIYKASRFKRARINDAGIETYMKLVPALTPEQDAVIRRRSEQNPRSLRIRASRLPQASQLAFA